MNVGQFERLMAQLHRMREGQDLGLGAIRDALQGRGQANAVLTLLAEIRDRLPVQEAPAPIMPVGAYGCPADPAAYVDTLFGAPSAPVAAPKGSELAAVKREALVAVLEALDGWIEGAQENHGALEHRHETRGEECWRRFAPSDIRNMVNDAARELGLDMFPAPDEPREDVR